MRIGLFLSSTDTTRTTLDEVVANARWAEEHGFDTGWVPHIPFSLDALVALAVAGRETSRLELGTAVVPTFPVHPLAMARAAATTQVAAGGRFTLGIGPSHALVIEDMHGIPYERPAAHTREFVEILREAFAGGGSVSHDGELLKAIAPFEVPGSQPIPILLAALAPRMLALAGSLADGTIAYWADEHALSEHVIPRITKAADEAGRSAPRVVAGFPVALCDAKDDAREQAERAFGFYAQIPTYQRILAHGKSTSPADVAIVGTQDQIGDRLMAYARIHGVTDLALSPVGLGDTIEAATANRTRTCEALAALRADLAKA